MDADASRGRKIVVGVVGVLLLMPIATIALQYWGIEAQSLPADTMRERIASYVFLLVLCAILYDRRNWARWLVGGCSFGVFVGSVAEALSCLLESRAAEINWIQNGIGLIYFVCAILLFLSPDVKKYFEK